MTISSITNDIRLALKDVSGQAFFQSADSLKILLPCECADAAVIISRPNSIASDILQTCIGSVIRQVDVCGIYANITLCDEYLTALAQMLASKTEYPSIIFDESNSRYYAVARLHTLRHKKYAHIPFAKDSAQRIAFLYCAALTEDMPNKRHAFYLGKAVEKTLYATEREDNIDPLFCECAIRLLMQA